MTRLLIFTLMLSVIGCKGRLGKNFAVVKDNYKIGYNENATENIFVKHYEDRGMMAVVINRKVKRIGFNDRFSIIERVGNYDDPGDTTLDTITIRYYIIDMTRPINIKDKDYCFGPTTYDKFLVRKKELGIEDLDFTKEFKLN
jgi:hypothetical protein